MKINSIELSNYGIFGEVPKQIDFKSGLNVIFGKNEAGKSTLRYAIGEMLYGFQHKKVGRHPYGNGLPMNLVAAFESDSAVALTIQRSLGDDAQYKRILNDSVQDMPEAPLSYVQDVPYPLYKGLFELDLSDLAKLDSKKWHAIEEQISMQFGLERIKPPRSVLLELEEEMYGIWRPHNRGKYVVKEIDEALLELGKRQRELQEITAGFDADSKQVAALSDRLDAVKGRISELDKLQKKAEAQMEPYRALKEAEELRESLERVEAMQLPAPEAIAYLVNEIDMLASEKAQLDLEIKTLEQSETVLSDWENAFLESGEAFEARFETYKQVKAKYEDERSEVEQIKRLLESKSKDLTSDPYNDALLNYWSVLDIGKLKRKVRFHGYKRAVFSLMMLLGLAAAGSGYALSRSELIYPGAGLGFAGLLGLLVNLKSRPLDFGDIRFRENIWNKNKVFLSACMSVQSDSQRLMALQKAYSDTKRRLEAVQTSLDEDLLHYVPDAAQESIESRLSAYKRGLVALRTRRQAAEISKSKLDALRGQKRKLGLKVMMQQQKLQAIKTRLLPLADDFEQAVKELELAKAGAHRKALLEGYLRDFDMNHPDLDDYRQEADFMEQINQIKTESDGLKEEKEVLSVKLKELERTQERSSHFYAVQALERKISKYELERKQAIEQYNKTRIVHSIIAYADKVFRERYQPDILMRASAYLKQFTCGGYDKLILDDQKNLNIRSTSNGSFIGVHDTLSRGTLEQIYLSIRIAVAEGIDRRSGSLPFVFDEILVNWDRDRMEGAVNTLKILSQKRQILYMTCHEWMRDMLKEAFDANVIDLS